MHLLPSCNMKCYLLQLKTYVRCYMLYAVNIRVCTIRVPIVMNAASHLTFKSDCMGSIMGICSMCMYGDM